MCSKPAALAKGLRVCLRHMVGQTLVLMVSGSASCLCRAVLASFRARRVRNEGVAIFSYWQDWAHWRALERRAIVAHWHKLMLLVRGGRLRESSCQGCLPCQGREMLPLPLLMSWAKNGPAHQGGGLQRTKPTQATQLAAAVM